MYFSPTLAGRFLKAMRQVPAQVTVVTTYADDRPWGLTVSAFCSVSADPPKVLVSVGLHTRTLSDVQATGRFGLSFLEESQSEIAELAGRPAQPKFIDRYCREADLRSSSDYGWHGSLTDLGGSEFSGSPAAEIGSPAIAGAFCQMDCVVSLVVPVADHMLVVGDVIDVQTPGGGQPRALLYCNHVFHGLGAPVPQHAAAPIEPRSA
jgi:flavin reductase ActVB